MMCKTLESNKSLGYMLIALNAWSGVNKNMQLGCGTSDQESGGGGL